MDPPPANNDGRVFRSPDRQAQIAISGGFITEGAASALRDAAGGVGVTYQRIGPNWAVASGVESVPVARVYDRRISMKKTLALLSLAALLASGGAAMAATGGGNNRHRAAPRRNVASVENGARCQADKQI
jgi:hypothetical protein